MKFLGEKIQNMGMSQKLHMVYLQDGTEVPYTTLKNSKVDLIDCNEGLEGKSVFFIFFGIFESFENCIIST